MIEVSIEVGRADVWRKAEADFQTLVAFSPGECRLETLAEALNTMPDLFESEWTLSCAELGKCLIGLKAIEISPTRFLAVLHLPDEVPAGIDLMIRALAEAYLSRCLLRQWQLYRNPQLDATHKIDVEPLLDRLTELLGSVSCGRPSQRKVIYFP